MEDLLVRCSDLVAVNLNLVVGYDVFDGSEKLVIYYDGHDMTVQPEYQAVVLTMLEVSDEFVQINDGLIEAASTTSTTGIRQVRVQHHARWNRVKSYTNDTTPHRGGTLKMQDGNTFYVGRKFLTNIAPDFAPVDQPA